MKITPASIPGLLIVENDILKDSRGHFVEMYRVEQNAFPPFVQENLSFSKQNVLRGMHLQHPHGQGKLVGVVDGKVFDVAVDLRRGSPHYGKHETFELSSDNYRQVYIPPGFAHGFYVLSEKVTFLYRVTDKYFKEGEIAIKWDDPDLGIRWPAGPKVISERDLNAPLLKSIPFDKFPSF